MSYNQKPPGPSGSGMGGGPPNGPNNIPQVSKTFAGIQQQMQNLVHGQNAIPQSSQADINAFLQQQRIQNMLKQQQQFLQFQHQMQAQQQQQQQQHQQQQQQLHNMPGGGGVGAGPVGVPAGVGAGGAGSGGAGGSGEPLALTRTPGAAELLNKTYQQQANGNPATNPTFNQLQQTLQALPTNFVQQLQAFQYQMQAKQMQQQQQHGGGQGHQGGHGQQQQPVQGVPPPPPPTTSAMSHQQQQHQQKHQHQQQQNAAALSTVAAVQQLQQRYLTAAAAAVSGNKISSATPPPPPPPLTNQMKPPNLPPNTQITPVTGANVGSNSLSSSSGSAGGGPHQKLTVGNTNTGLAKHQAPPPPAPSISLTPSKQNASTPSVAHQQNKFMPPTNSGGKGGHSGHSQNLSKSTHGGQTSSSNTTSPAKTVTNADTVVAAVTASTLKSPQLTPVQLTKQTATVASTVGNKTSVNTTAGVTSAAMVSPQKSTATVSPSASNTNTTTGNPTNSNASQAKQNVTKATTEDLATTKMPTKPLATEKEVPKLPTKEDTKKPTDATTPVSLCTGSNKKDIENQSKENKLETAIAPKTPLPISSSLNQPSEKACIEVKNKTTTAATVTVGVAQIESKAITTSGENKLDAMLNLNKTENHSLDPIKDEADKKSIDAKKIQEKNKPLITEEKSTTPVNTSSQQETSKKQETDDKKSTNQTKKSNDEIKTDRNEETAEIEKKPKSIKALKIGGESIIAKDTSKLETETEKLNTAAETKSSTTTSSAITVTSTEKANVNVKNSVETSQKNDKQPLEIAAVQQKSEEKESPIISNAENKKSTENLDSLKGEAVKDKEEPPKHNKTNEMSESTIPVKSATSTKTNNDDTVREITDIGQKETSIVAATPPVKKFGRLTKGAKSKIAIAPPATVPVEVVDSITPETQLEENPSTAAAATTSARVKRKSINQSTESYVIDSAPSTPRDDDLDRKSKRHRLKTILYQSPLPELAYITKLSASEASNSPKPMSNEDRLIVFYKNEYMAVRNSEGTFYLCQTMQNVYRTSPRISIRWLSEDVKDNNVYIPDFYDHTDIECVLTTVELKRIDKGHLRLPKTERIRIENILKKAIDVEKGIVPRPDMTEENPDGLDISLYKDESQIEKKSSADSGGIESVTPSTTTGRKSRKGHAVAASSLRKSMAAATPSTSSAGNKRKRGVSLAASTSTSNSRKSPAKKRKTLLKRKKKMAVDLSADENDDETSDDYESDTEYKPTQKRSTLNTSAAGSKTTPRAQRSPLAKARAASPITPTTSRTKNVPQKTTPTPSTSKVSRGERAAKRKSITDAGSSEENPTPVKKPMTSSASTNNGKTTNNNKNKVASKSNSNATTTPVKKSLNDSKTLDSTNRTMTTTTSPTTPNTSEPASATNSPKSGNNGLEDSAGGGGGVDSNVNRPARSRK